MDQAKALLDRIHAERIRPVPRWVVLVKRAFLFALFGSVILFGTISVSLAIQEIHAHAGRGWLLRKTMADYAPYVWSLTAVLIVWVGVRVFRELPRGWRVKPWHVGTCIALVCALGGWGVERSEALLNAHRALAHAVPAYRELWMNKALASWHDPASGRIAGTLVLATDSVITLAGVDGVSWTVIWEGQGALPEIPSIRLLGRVCGEARFCAEDWKPAPGYGNKNRVP